LALRFRQSESFALRSQYLDKAHVRQCGYFIDGEWHVDRAKIESSDLEFSKVVSQVLGDLIERRRSARSRGAVK
jgi:hypothetical protein